MIGVNKKTTSIFFVSTVIAVSAMTRLFADSVFFVGKNASVDGTTLIGRAVDLEKSPARTYFELVPRVENKSGRRHWGSDGFVWYYPPTTWRTISLSRMKSDEVGSEAAFAMNEKGLVVIAVRTDVPQSENVEAINQMSGGATEREYPAVLTKYCTNAVQSVELVKSIISRCGSGRANIILIADPKEAYIVETHLGNKCETIRLDDDAFISFGDSFTLDGFKMAKATKKYSLKDAFEMLRKRKNSKHSSAHHVLELSSSVPKERSVTAWTSLSDSAFGVFLPVSNAMEEFDDVFKANDSRPNPHVALSEDYAVDTFLRLQSLGSQDRSLYGRGIMNYWLAREDELIAGWKKRFPNATSKSLTNYSRKELPRAIADAKRLVEEIQYAMLHKTQFEASDFDQIALNQMQKEGIVRYPVMLEKGPVDFSDVPKWAPKMDEWKDPTLVQWGKPLALGKKRVLVCVMHQDTFAAQHLKNRIDLDVDIIESGYFRNTDVRWTSKLKRLERALESNVYDGYVFLGTGPSYWPKRLQRKLAELQIQGRSVALVNAGNWGVDFKEDVDFARGAPRSFEVLTQDPHPDAGEFDLVWTNTVLPTISIGSLGKGKVVRLDLPRGAKETYMVNPRFSPSWTMTPDRVFHDEYCYAYSCRAVMESLGLRDTAKVVQVRNNEVVISNSVSVNATATLSLRDAWGKCVLTKEYPLELKEGETKLPIDLGNLNPGYYGVDVILRTKTGVLDYAMDLFSVKPKEGESAISSALLDKECFMPTEIITGEVKVKNPRKNLKVVACVKDPRQRTILKGEWAVDPATGITKISLDQKRLRLNCHFMYFTLVDENGKILDKARDWFFRKILDGEKGDFRIFDSGTSHGGKDCEPRLAILEWHGMSLLQHGNAQRLFYGSDPAIRERIPGRKSIWDSSLSSPAWTNWLVKTYTKHAKSLANKNGRLISLGDDSTECWDFYEGRPDWSQPFFNLLEKHINKLADVKIKAGNRRGLHITKEEWLSERGLNPKIVGWNFYWGFQVPVEKKIGIPKLLSALKDEDLPLIKEAIKKSYDDIRVFNYANRVSVKDFDSIDINCVRKMKPVRKPEFPYFIKWLSERYGTPEKISKAWGVKVDDIWGIDMVWFEKIVREGNVYAGVDRDRFLEGVFDMNCKLIGETVRKVDPSIIVGYGASWVGHELQEQFDWLSLSAGYATSCILQTNRRLRKPNTYIGECIGWYGWPIGWVCEERVSKERRIKEGWSTLFRGANFCWMWTTSYGLNGARTISPNGYGWLFETLGEIYRGPAALLNRAKRADDGVAVLLSLQTHPLSRLGEGRKNNLMESLWWTHQCSLNQIGFEYITPRDICSGELEKRGTKLLILPDIDYVDQKTADEIRAYVNKGGAVYANRIPRYDIDGRKLSKGLLDDVFSNTNAPLTRVFQSSNGASTFLNGIKELGITAKVGVTDEKGNRKGGIVRFDRENGEYAFSIEKDKAEKEVFPQQAFVELENPGAVYDVRTGKRVGEGAIKRFPIEFYGLDVRLFSWQPYSVDGIDIEFATKPVRGGTLRLKANLITTPLGDDKTAKPGKRVFRVEFIPPEGFPKTTYEPIPRYLPDAPNGELVLDIPLAFDERGDLVIEVTDVATGVKAQKKLEF